MANWTLYDNDDVTTINSTQLPTITGKPFTPKRAIKPWYEDVVCTDDKCTRRCWCGPSTYSTHEYVHGVCEPHKHQREIEPGRTNGTGWLERKASGELVYHTPWLRTRASFELKPLKARNETAAKALARMRKEYVSDMERDNVARVIGADAGDGFRIAATNGHWALLEPGAATVQAHRMDFLKPSNKHKAHVLDNSDLWLALQRAKCMSDARSHSVIMLGRTQHGRVVVYSEDQDNGNFVEQVYQGITAPFQVAFNYQYLEMVLGCWPLTMYVRDEDTAVIFEPQDKTWRFVLMPLRAEFKGVLKAETEVSL